MNLDIFSSENFKQYLLKRSDSSLQVAQIDFTSGVEKKYEFQGC